jgi:aryl-alcohol dehydrogenase-like predicted oxidoreductase
METKPLGHSGLKVSAVGLGCMNFGLMCDQAAADAIVNAALEQGITFFDVADIYGGPAGKAETLLGKALGPRRAGIVLASKFGAKLGGRGGAAEKGGSREYIVQAVEQSLGRLGTDHLDLYQHHFPDNGTPVEETLRALDDLVRTGKVRYAGCSNYTGEQLKAAAIAARAVPFPGYVSAQNRYSLLHRDIEKDLVPIAQGQQIGIIPYFPLESGLLSGKYRRGEKPPPDTRFGKWGGGGGFVSEERWASVARLQAYAESVGRSLLDLAIGWLAAQPFVSSVIAGVTNPDQVVQNVRAASWAPTPEQLATIGELAGR